MRPRLEEVFSLSGIPSYTYVIPQEYTQLKIAIRTPGRGVVVEGPSGIGKTTAIMKAVEELGIVDDCLILTARSQKDRDTISGIPEADGFGVIIIDDFHRLDDELKERISDKMKVLADNGDTNSKIIIVGINKAGDSLVQFSPDLNNRIDTIHFETNSRLKIRELIEKGENALNITLENKKDIVENAFGSFHITQMLCQKSCILQDITEKSDRHINVNTGFYAVSNSLYEELSRIYAPVAKAFATGPRLRREGRLPYLYILNWLAESNDWSLQLNSILGQYPKQRASVGQVIDKGYLSDFIESHKDSFDNYLHYDKITKILSIEDPKFAFYLKNISWRKFAIQVGYLRFESENEYDIALSFAGADREIARKLFEKLTEYGNVVFYDENEQSRMLAENIESYLYRIYKSDATFVVPLLSREYPKRLWTKFESETFKDRFGSNSIIPIWFSNADIGMFDESRKYGGIDLNVDQNIDIQIDKIVSLISQKLDEINNAFIS